MKGQLLIDGIDAYTTLGISVIKGSYNNLVAFPPMKEPDKNDWPEEDGQEFDLSNPVLDAGDVNIELELTTEFQTPGWSYLRWRNS